MLEAYPDEIRADLQQVYGVDLAVEWRNRRWRKLLVLISQLPSASRFTQAYMTDERNAEALAAAQLRTEQSDESPRMGFTEWNLQATMLAQLIDAVHSLNQTVVAVGGGKPHQPKPFPRPESIGKQALQEIREKSAASFLDEITADHDQNKY